MFLSLSKIEALQERAGAMFALFTYVSQCLVPCDNITGKNAKVLYGFKIDINMLYHFICCFFFFWCFLQRCGEERMAYVTFKV